MKASVPRWIWGGAYEFENRKSVVLVIGVNGGKDYLCGKAGRQLKARKKR